MKVKRKPIGDPREYIKGIIAALGITRTDFCRAVGLIPQDLSAFFNKERLLSKNDCLKLEKSMGIPFMELMTVQLKEWYEAHKN